jgi:hypothetical protein
MEATSQYQLIEKESVSGLHFPDQEVLNSAEAIKERQAELTRALSLGNLEHLKIKIYFEDSVSLKIVDTTVWGLTDKRIILKQGVVIPIHRVHKIRI